MKDVVTEAEKLEAKHALFVFDSCFSGSVLKTKSRTGIPPQISARTSKPVRHFITAGSAQQVVPSESYFTPALVQGLEGDADLNGDEYVTASELGMFLQDEVGGYDVGLTPQSDKINNPELNEGDFVFEAKPPAKSPSLAYQRGRLAAKGGDDAQAVEHYQEACDGGYAPGCTSLGRMYLGGLGLTQDSSRAARSYRQGCEGGDAAGCTGLGVVYEDEGTSQGDTRAVDLFKRGCDEGDPAGCTHLGQMHGAGRAVSEDKTRAAELYRQGCDQGDSKGCISLASAYFTGQGVQQDPERAFELLSSAAAAGDRDAYGALGMLYEMGRGAPQDDAKALEAYREGCDRESADSCAALAFAYEKGQFGLTPDSARARKLYEESCAAGSDLACANLRRQEEP